MAKEPDGEGGFAVYPVTGLFYPILSAWDDDPAIEDRDETRYRSLTKMTREDLELHLRLMPVSSSALTCHPSEPSRSGRLACHS